MPTEAVNLPLYIGKIGATPIWLMAQRVVERMPEGRLAALVLGEEGDVWLDEADAVSTIHMVGMYRRGYDAAALAEDLEDEARSRGLLR